MMATICSSLVSSVLATIPFLFFGRTSSVLANSAAGYCFLYLNASSLVAMG
jgi:hypothetical protein